MKYTTLLMVMVLTAAAAVGHSSAIDPSPSQPDLTSLPIGYGSEDLRKGSYEVSNAFDSTVGEAYAINGSSPAAVGQNRLMYRGNYVRESVMGKGHIHKQTWRGYTVITSMKFWEQGLNQGAKKQIIEGGLGKTFVTVQFYSVIGRGFNIMMEVYG